MTIRVMVVDDQSLIRSGLVTLLASAPDIEVVAEAADGAEAVPLARTYRPDVVLMDLVMPKVDGMEATLQLLRLPEPPRVLVLTGYTADDLVLDALRAGAAGFLLKDLRPEELFAGIRTVAAGGSALAPGVMRVLLERADTRTEAPDHAEQLSTLSPGERDVLALVGEGRTNLQIAEALHLSPASVKTYVSRILTQLDLSNRTQAAILAYEAGLVRAA
ncbi:response regulator transcription factor [Streptomyces sp. ZAF1911]|uniref:response regulator transcription factor n=1 Tax=unclassified Streptomyces TaxID=2593676 RepID=UPI00202EB569|nr:MULTISPECIES: response regulator transcription factor [unclassified Streptomyces]MCM1971422.1 response regulator transcription factor [Streptomyces sp. G1]MCX5125151.1 response regulator transcription factor [Streptomyces sp. NBC_00347]MCX5299031.1 response regulator transcription factor [Streptomyces sp. NBC_00193]MDD9381827.1 response regulator transcription factor [Streptomyces sp. ZAF1911]